MKWCECGRCGKVYPETRKNPFFHRCGECRASLDHYDWTFRDVVYVTLCVVGLFVIAGITAWLVI